LITEKPNNQDLIDKQRIKYIPPEALEFLTEELNYDIWSFGCILIDIFSKEDPIFRQNRSLEELFKLHTINMFPVIPKDITGLLRDIIVKCLDRNYETRISINELMENLNILLDNIITSI
jgi:serine/threonine protein kinase